MDRFKQTEKRWSLAAAQDSVQEQRHSKEVFPLYLSPSFFPSSVPSPLRMCSHLSLTLSARPTLLSVHLLSSYPALTDNYVFYLEKFYSWHIQK